MSVSAVVTEHTTERSTESNEEGTECADSEPVGVSVLGLSPVIADVFTGDTKEDHGDDPDYEGAKGSECREEGHEDCAHPVVGGSADTKKDGETRKASG